MLDALGYGSLADFVDAVVPTDIRLRRPLDLPPARTEQEALAELRRLAAQNQVFRSYLGMGYHDCVTPPVILRNVLENPGWYTAYTPYQAEISQGMLQALFEYQSIVAELTGMDSVNTSMYDGPTALGEAARMAYRIKEGEVFLIPRAIHPDKKSILKNYLVGTPVKLLEVPFDPATGQITAEALSAAASKHLLSGVYIESPNCFGVLEEIVPEARSIVGPQTPLDCRHIRLAGIHCHEDADLRVAGKLARKRLQVVNAEIKTNRQRQCDADHNHIQPGGERLARQPDQTFAQRVEVGQQPIHAASLPWSRCRIRGPRRPIRASSWVAITTVTPT